MFDKMFEGHFSAITDTHPATDPWGLGMTVEVLREDHKDWQDWQKANASAGSRLGELGDQITQAVGRMAIREALMQNAGFRKEPKKTKAEMEAQATSDQPCEAERRAEEMIDRTIATLPKLKLDAVGPELNSIKPGVASVLMRGWSNVTDPGGNAIEFNLHNALRFVGWEGALVEVAGEDPKFLRDESEIGYKIIGASCTLFTGNPRKPDGSLWACPVGMKYGPLPVGDAITLWLIDASKEGSLVKMATMEGAADFLGDTRPGAPDTSETIQ